MYIKHRHELRHARMAWTGILVDPCLLSGGSYRIKDLGDEVERGGGDLETGGIIG